MYNFMLAKNYDVSYLLTTSICKNGIFVSNKTSIQLKNVMFYKSTEHYYTFYAKDSGQYIKFKKANLLHAKEV